MRIKEIIHELTEHSPFTALATLSAVIIAFFLVNKQISEESFHVLHPIHVLASAIVASGIFYKYKKNIVQALLIGAAGSIVIGSLSDIIFPYLGGLIFNMPMEFHLPLIETPFLILSVAIAGSILGMSFKITKFPHFVHIFVSVFASLFYMLAFGPNSGVIYFIEVFLIVFVSVIIPCCLSDIILPLLFTGKREH